MSWRGVALTLAVGALLTGCVGAPAPTETERADDGAPEHPIQIVDGAFVDTRTGRPFAVRGTNYFNIVPAAGGLQDRFFSPGVFDAEQVRSDFDGLAARGYTTVRIFLDTCTVGPVCIAEAGAEGLNPEFLDNIAETLRIARDAGIFLVLTSNDLPDGGPYTAIADRGSSAEFAGYRNTVFLTAEGAEAASRYWADLLTGLLERSAPLDAVLAWSIVNEQWVFSAQPPLSLDEGEVTGADGRVYDLADAEQKRALVIAGVTNYLNTAAATIREHDPTALVTSGFFAPKFPNPTSIGGDWYVDTAPLLTAADLDFFDFHAYPASDISIAQIAENFGMPDAPDVPVIMGEVGAFVADYDSAADAALALQEWTADSCAAGFDGWLQWGYLRAPIAIGDAAWGLRDDSDHLLDALAPTAWPDPCTPVLVDPDLARTGTATASRELPDEPAAAAIDGEPNTQWGSGADAPQWIEVTLAEPATVGLVRLRVAQYPEGRTVHVVEVRGADGAWREVGVLDGETRDGDVLELEFAPVPDATAVRVTTRTSPSWVSWRSVEILAD